MALRAQTLGISYLNDSSLHEQMVRFATAQFRAGQLPLTSWFPYLGLGSPQFLHYQSLPAMLAGAVGLAVGPDVAFRWSLYLLLSLWPVSVYLSARLFGLGRGAAAAAAAMSPFLVSITGVGYEQHAYVWKGYGVWTQLWAMFTLPLAWGLGWRAIRSGRGYLAAVVCVALTVALHFETGYLALIPLLFWPLVAGHRVAAQARRAAVVLAGSLLCAAWVIVPLLAQRDWAATNQILRGTPLVDGYGAGRVLAWLVTGQLLDHGRLPIVTVLAAVGFALAYMRSPRDANARALLVALAVSLLLSFGRATFGALVDVIPGSGDVFFRRFEMGIQLAALLLGGLGASWCARAAWDGWDRTAAWLTVRWPPSSATGRTLVRPAVTVAAAIVVLAPAWLQLGSYARANATTIGAQRRAEAAQGPDLDRLIAYVRQHGGGRVYAGLPSNWGVDLTVGAVPVFKYLESKDIDEVGYTLRTASLMTDPEYFFDEDDPGDYRLFGIRYVIVASNAKPPVPAQLVIRSGPYALWTVDPGGYVHVGEIVGAYPANRTDLGTHSVLLLHSGLAQHDQYLRVHYGSDGPAVTRLPPVRSGSPAGTVIAEHDALQDGQATATVRMRRAGVAVLSASFDPGWTVTVDGRRVATEMVAPALVGVPVPTGVHRLVFVYRGYGHYPVLFALAGLTLAGLLTAQITLRQGW